MIQSMYLWSLCFLFVFPVLPLPVLFCFDELCYSLASIIHSRLAISCFLDDPQLCPPSGQKIGRIVN